MRKASFASVLAVMKKPPLRDYNYINLEGILSSGVTIGVLDSSSYEDNFIDATSGPFKKAWDVMKDNKESFVESVDKAIARMLTDDKFAFFYSLSSMAGLDVYKSCQVSPIPTR